MVSRLEHVVTQERWGGAGGEGKGCDAQSYLLVKDIICVTCCYVRRVSVTADGMESVITLARGDMRRALNILQVARIRTSTQQCLG